MENVNEVGSLKLVADANMLMVIYTPSYKATRFRQLMKAGEGWV